MFHKVESTGNILTCEAVLFYARSAIEGKENDNGDLVYRAALCFPPETDFKILKNAMGKVALENVEDANQARKFVEKVFSDPNDRPQGGRPAGPEFEGWTQVNTSSKNKPDIISPHGKKFSPEEVQSALNSGDWVRVTVDPYWRNVKKNPGVSLGLQNIQLVRKGKPIGYVKPAGESEFGVVEGADDMPTPSSGNGETKSGADQVDALFG